MPKSIKKRTSKKVTGTETDVKEKLASLKDTLHERRKTVLRYGAIILVVLLAIPAFLFYDYSSRKKAKALEYDAYKIYQNIYQTQPLPSDERYKKALDIFKKSYETKKTPSVLLYIAGCYYELGNYDEAIRTLKDFTQRYEGEDDLIPIAYEKLAMAYERKGDTKEALKALESLYHLKGDIYKDLALIESARLLEKEGKTDEAMKKYKELSEKFPNSPFSDEAKVKLGGKKEG
jgi:predicted negative regulator of RcsB-dependent stress response